MIVSKYFARDALGTSDLDDDFAELCSAYGQLLDSGALPADPSAVHEPAVMSVYVGRGAEQNFASGGRRGWWGWRQTHPDHAAVQPETSSFSGSGTQAVARVSMPKHGRRIACNVPWWAASSRSRSALTKL